MYIYRLENRKIEVCRSRVVGGPMGVLGPRERQVSLIVLKTWHTHRSANFEPFLFVGIFRFDA